MDLSNVPEPYRYQCELFLRDYPKGAQIIANYLRLVNCPEYRVRAQISFRKMARGTRKKGGLCD